MWFLFVFRAVIAMAQVQLNSPTPPQHEATKRSETSQLNESRPLDPPDPSFSLRSDEQPPVSVETRTPDPSLSLSYQNKVKPAMNSLLSPQPEQQVVCMII